jgi:glycogen operon protein
MACGIPDVSYHGENAWVVPDEIASRQLGVLYHGGEGKQAHCFLAYNMHWLKHQFAIPTLDKSKVWKKVWDTTVEETDASKFSPDQRSIELKPRSCVLLVQEERKEVKRDRKHGVERVGE